MSRSGERAKVLAEEGLYSFPTTEGKEPDRGNA
jgi:hypothetical protein